MRGSVVVRVSWWIGGSWSGLRVDLVVFVGEVQSVSILTKVRSESEDPVPLVVVRGVPVRYHLEWDEYEVFWTDFPNEFGEREVPSIHPSRLGDLLGPSLHARMNSLPHVSLWV